MAVATSIELFTARICPFAHRTRLVLLEKDLQATITEIDFENKPQRFLAVSRYGKVPAILHDGVEIYESAIINEYLEEVFPDPALMPEEPARRAQVRIWIDYCDSQLLDDHYALLKTKDPTEAAALKAKVEDRLRFIEREGLARLGGAGPYWLGERVSLLDIAYYPFFERLPAWEHYRGIRIPDGCPRLAAWREAMAARPSVRSMANAPAYYIEHYKGYAGEVLVA